MPNEKVLLRVGQTIAADGLQGVCETSVMKLAFRKRSLISKWPAFDSSTVRTTMVMVAAALCTPSHTLHGGPAKVVEKEFDDL